MRPLYIFELDGTLADVRHRRHILLDETDPHRWTKFYEACVDDLPNRAVINTLWALGRMLDIEIRVWSGRSDRVRPQTEAWLRTHIGLTGVVHSLVMRPADDFTPDEELKRSWYRALPYTDKACLVAVFDDRDRVVAMWREMGVTCFQVAEGDF